MDKNIFGKFPLSGKTKSKKEKDQMAEFLQLDADAMSSFESSYQKHVLNKPFSSMNLFDVNAKLAVTENARFKNPFFEENEDVVPWHTPRFCTDPRAADGFPVQDIVAFG